jgi:hypothetical protein
MSSRGGPVRLSPLFALGFRNLRFVPEGYY